MLIRVIFSTFLVIFKILSYLPYGFLLFIGRTLGTMCFYLFKKQRLITEINIKMCFPNMSCEERLKLVKISFQSLGMGIIETLYAWVCSDSQLPKVALIEGTEHVQQAKDANKNIIMLGMHQVSSEMAGKLYSRIQPFNAVYQKTSIKAIDDIVLKYRSKIYNKLIPNHNVREMVKRLENKEMLWFAPDQAPKKKHRVYIPFFGIETATSTSTSALAKMANAIVLPVYLERTKNYTEYKLYIGEPIKDFPSDNVEQDALAINRVFERLIKRNPEQYLWQYKRFKNTKDNSSNVYDIALKK